MTIEISITVCIALPLQAGIYVLEERINFYIYLYNFQILLQVSWP